MYIRSIIFYRQISEISTIWEMKRNKMFLTSLTFNYFHRKMKLLDIACFACHFGQRVSPSFLRRCQLHSNPSSIQASRHQASRSRPPESEILILGGSNPLPQGITGRHRPPQGGTGRHRMAQGFNGRPTFWPQNFWNPWKAIEFFWHLWESLKIY